MESTVSDPKHRAPAPAEPGMGDKMGIYVGIVGGVVLLDVVTKFIVQRTMRLYDPIPVLGETFRLTYIYNRGAAFGMNVGEFSRIFFSVLTVGAVIGLFFWFRSTPISDRLRLFALASVTGGAIGNLIDRIRSPLGVVDFFDVDIPDLWTEGMRWPVFNIADIAVSVGAVLLAISLWKEDAARAREAAEGGRD